MGSKAFTADSIKFHIGPLICLLLSPAIFVPLFSLSLSFPSLYTLNPFGLALLLTASVCFSLLTPNTMSSILSKRPRALSKLLCNIIFVRNMGGGPRTFPGGVNKWKWKRMHEKRARDKERRLLEQEKQLYQARIRSHIRAKIAGKQEEASSASHGPMSPEDHIKALANRFMKEGAEDLWNRNDGPLKPPPLSRKELPRSSGRPGSIGSPLDLRKLIPERHNGFSNRESGNYTNTSSNYAQTRNYSVQSWGRFPRNESSSSEGDSNSVLKENSASPVIRNIVSNSKSMNNKNVDDYVNNKKISPRSWRKFWRNDGSSSDYDSDLDSSGEPANYLRGQSLSIAGRGISNETEDLRTVRDVKRMGSSASLGKYDIKTKRRVLPTLYDEERDLSEQVELIRYELDKRKLSENEERKGEEKAVLSQSR